MKYEKIFEWTSEGRRYRLLQGGRSAPYYRDALVIEVCQADNLGGERWAEDWRWSKSEGDAPFSTSKPPIVVQMALAAIDEKK